MTLALSQGFFSSFAFRKIKDLSWSSFGEKALYLCRLCLTAPNAINYRFPSFRCFLFSLLITCCYCMEVHFLLDKEGTHEISKINPLSAFSIRCHLVGNLVIKGACLLVDCLLGYFVRYSSIP